LENIKRGLCNGETIPLSSESKDSVGRTALDTSFCVGIIKGLEEIFLVKTVDPEKREEENNAM